MPLGKFQLPEKDTRLIKYKDKVYKVKLHYRNDNSDDAIVPSNTNLPCSQDEVQSEMEEAIRAVLAMEGKLHTFRTNHFIIHPEKKYWNAASLLKFFEHGQQLTGDPYFINLVVEGITNQSTTHGKTHSEQNQVMGDDQDQSKEKHKDDMGGRAGPSRTSRSGAMGDGDGSASSPDARISPLKTRMRHKKSQSSPEDNSGSQSDVVMESEPERPRFHSPPRKHCTYALRKRAASQLPGPSRHQPKRAAKRLLTVEAGEPYNGRKTYVLSKENRYMLDSSRNIEDRVREGGGRHLHQATPINMKSEVAATVSDELQPAHPQGGVLLHEMLRPSHGQIEQHQLEEQMRLRRLAGPASVNRGHPAFASSTQTGNVEAPKSTIKKLIDVMLTPAKKLFSQ